MWGWFGRRRVVASAGAKRRAEQVPVLEALDPIESAITFVGRDAETDGALMVRTPTLEGAIYSSRGRRYARYDEDAAYLFADGRGRLHAGVFDQAGGLGGEVRGEASRMTASRLARCARAYCGEELSVDRVPESLASALSEAHESLVVRGQKEVTTAVCASIDLDGTIYLASSGDSAALLFDSEGKTLNSSDPDAHTGPGDLGFLMYAVGITPGGPDPRTAVWRLDPPDLLLLCTDGVLDAGLDLGAAARDLAAIESLEDGVNALIEEILSRMSGHRAKPDNLTLIAIRRPQPLDGA